MGAAPPRPVAAVLALCLLLSGCSTVLDGRPVPADHNGPVPVKDSALRGALLDIDEINTVMHASEMEQQSSGDDLLADSHNFDRSCLAAWQPIQRSVYQDSDYSAVRGELLSEDDGVGDHHYAIQAVVGFPSRSAVTDFFEEMTQDWTSCGDREFTATTSGGIDIDWKFGSVEQTGSTLSVTQVQRHSDDWSCLHVLRASNNVVIDVISCMTGGGDEAMTIVDKVDAKLPSI